MPSILQVCYGSHDLGGKVSLVDLKGLQTSVEFLHFRGEFCVRVGQGGHLFFESDEAGGIIFKDLEAGLKAVDVPGESIHYKTEAGEGVSSLWLGTVAVGV